MSLKISDKIKDLEALRQDIPEWVKMTLELLQQIADNTKGASP